MQKLRRAMVAPERTLLTREIDEFYLLSAGWPDERSVRAALVEPVEPIVVTRIFEDVARGG